MSDSTEDTVVASEAASFNEKFFAPRLEPIEVRFGAATHEGKVRSHNEDHYAVVKRSRSSKLLLSNLAADDLALDDDYAYTMIVADGIGGANRGELASRLAIQTMFELSNQATSWVMRFTDLDVQQIRQRAEAFVERIQSTLRRQSEADSQFAGMGTTWTSAHLFPPFAVIAHLGDSRAYLFHDGVLTQVTRDETMAQVLIESGIEPEQVKKNFGHILLNSFGGSSDEVAAQIRQVRLEPPDRLLLCSDGLSDMIADDDIARELARHDDPQAACDALLNLALENGGKDNVTVVIAAAEEK